MKCCIPFCNGLNCSTFSVPKNAFSVWQNSLKIKLKSNSRICEKHFKKEDIIKTWVSGSKQESQYTICYKRPKLREGAIPTVNGTTELNILTDLSTSEMPGVNEGESIDYTENCDQSMFVNSNSNNSFSMMSDSCTIPRKRKALEYIQSDHSYSSNSSGYSEPTHLFENLLKSLNKISLPPKWFMDIDHEFKNKSFVGFHQLGVCRDDFSRVVKKQIILTEDCSLIIHVYGVVINIEQIGLFSNFKPENVEDLKNIIMLFDKLKICNGSVLTKKYDEIKSKFGPQFIESYGQWRHRNCPTVHWAVSNTSN